MEFSIVIPVFNKADFTDRCLSTLRPTIADAGEGEIIVVDNGSTDHTDRVLAKHAWAKVIRNAENRGFAAANNQGAAEARGRFVVFLNNDTQAHSGWLRAMLDVAREPGVGAVGARLLFPDRTVQHAGTYTIPLRFGSTGFAVFHYLYGAPENHPGVLRRRDMRSVTAACLVTPRELFMQKGGFDQTFWNGYEDIDYCFKLVSAGLRVVYEPSAVVTHFESQSGVQRKRQTTANIDTLSEHWKGRVVYDANALFISDGLVRREIRLGNGALTFETFRLPKTTVVLHGAPPEDADAFFARLRENEAEIADVVWACDGPPPDVGVPMREGVGEPIETVRREMEWRGDRYVAIVNGATRLKEHWLDELIRQAEWGYGIGAATFAPELPSGEDVSSYAADARCTLLSLRQFPQHLRVRQMDTLDGAIADFLIRSLEFRRGVRGAAFALGDVPAVAKDASFEAVHGVPLTAVLTTDPGPIESALRAGSRVETRGKLVSIVTLSWNAPQFTKLALESIQAHTRAPYEIIIVDNGSGSETIEWLEGLQFENVRVIYNPSNYGFAHGNNQGIAAARGDYVVLLNNDVVVTDGWLDGLLTPFERIPGLGMTGPRSNIVAGDQQVTDAKYADLAAMHAYAAKRRRDFAGNGYLSDRIIGLCLCIDRRVIDEIGGIDERYGVGNFEDDDFCMRVRGAGYKLFVCNDVFIHHFGSQSFAANKVDYRATMQSNWAKFAQKWGLPPEYPTNGYSTQKIITRGFDPTQHFFGIDHHRVPQREEMPAETEGSAAVAFLAVVRDERDWTEVGSLLKKYATGFSSGDSTLFAIAAHGSIPAETLGERVRRSLSKLALNEASVGDILISDESDLEGWIAGLPAHRQLRVWPSDETAGPLSRVEALRDRSPSGMRRALQPEALAER
ncbi:MAG: glycosyltransferase family 2 protein [Candidatus Eremiobacteraeota bacterium]|nr:glycosyltransferase family 2 protein [Candidatus Eremiobacteraeota bacterium]